VVEGDCLGEVSLSSPLEKHSLSGSALTLVLKELDFTQKARLTAQRGEQHTYDIFGLSQLKEVKAYAGDSYQRLVFKSNNIEKENMDLILKPSLMKK
jgi:hypothetical protein